MPEVLTFPDSPADVVASLRNLADKIEAGEYPGIRFAGVVLCVNPADVKVEAYGHLNTLEVAGAFLRAADAAAMCSKLR